MYIHSSQKTFFIFISNRWKVLSLSSIRYTVRSVWMYGWCAQYVTTSCLHLLQWCNSLRTAVVACLCLWSVGSCQTMCMCYFDRFDIFICCCVLRTPKVVLLVTHQYCSDHWDCIYCNYYEMTAYYKWLFTTKWTLFTQPYVVAKP